MTVPIASGREADVFALDGTRVLRRYRRAADVSAEAAMMRRVAALGYPVPHVFEAQGAEMVLERLDGPTLAGAMATGSLAIPAGASLLAGLLRDLHALGVIHQDLHPENVMLTGDGPRVIDWCNATEGPGDLDTAMTALIVAQVAVDPSHPWSAQAGEFLDAFLPVAPGRPLRFLDDVARIRSGQRTATPEELDLMGTAVRRVRGDS